MEVSRQLHDLASLPLRKELPMPIGQEAGWAPEPVWTTWRKLEFRPPSTQAVTMATELSRHKVCTVAGDPLSRRRTYSELCSKRNSNKGYVLSVANGKPGALTNLKGTYDLGHVTKLKVSKYKEPLVSSGVACYLEPKLN
jgi:hypothetical protein